MHQQVWASKARVQIRRNKIPLSHECGDLGLFCSYVSDYQEWYVACSRYIINTCWIKESRVLWGCKSVHIYKGNLVICILKILMLPPKNLWWKCMMEKNGQLQFCNWKAQNIHSSYIPEECNRNLNIWLVRSISGGFPGGAVVENLPANAGNMGSRPGLGRSHMPRSN